VAQLADDHVETVGAEIDYKEDLQGAQFIIRNPNAQTTCGCGSSFSV
jgi:iron-sulfur cluster insertion protein